MKRHPATSPNRPKATTALLALVLGLTLLAAPAAAESACTSDPRGDTKASDAGQVDEPQADILAACVTFDESQLVVTVRVAEPTDPATNPVWDQTRTAVGVDIDIDGQTSPDAGGGEFLANLARFTDEGGATTEPQVRVYDLATNEVTTRPGGGACILPAGYDGVRYTLTIPIECLSNHSQVTQVPTAVRTAPFFVHDRALGTQEGSFDELPDFPNYLGPYTTSADPDTPADRLQGPSRTETAIQVSLDGFPADGSASAVVLARADASPDALAGAPLAKAKNGPLLLTNRNSLPSAVRDELLRVLPSGSTVYLAGGTSAVSDDVAEAVEQLGFTVERVQGLTRYATSVAIAREANPDPSVIVVADGNSFADALVGGSLAAFRDGVQVLSNGDRLDNDGDVEAYLAEHPDAEVIAVGQLATTAVPDARSLAGDDQFQTSVAVAREYADVDGVAIASGTNFPDGLAGGAHAARLGDPLLLSWPDVLPASVRDHLTTIGAGGAVTTVTVYGGPVALSPQVERDVAAALGIS